MSYPSAPFSAAAMALADQRRAAQALRCAAKGCGLPRALWGALTPVSSRPTLDLVAQQCASSATDPQRKAAAASAWEHYLQTFPAGAGAVQGAAPKRRPRAKGKAKVRASQAADDSGGRAVLDGGRRWSDVAGCDGAGVELTTGRRGRRAHRGGQRPACRSGCARPAPGRRSSQHDAGRANPTIDHSGCDRGHTRRVAPLGEGA